MPRWRYIGLHDDVTDCCWHYYPDACCEECKDGSCPGKIYGDCPFANGPSKDEYKRLFKEE